MDELNILLFGKYPGFFKDKLLEIINSINPNIKNTFTNDFKNLQNKIDVTNPDLFIFLIPNQFENSKTTLEFITTTSYNLKLIVISEDYNFELSNTLFIHPISDYLWLKDIKRSYSILKKEIQLLSNHFHNKNKKELDNLFFSGLEIISTDSYLILDPFSLKISYCSQNIYNLIGVTKEEILEYSSEDLKDLIYQKDLNKLQNLFFQIQSSGFIDFPELNIRVKSKLIGGYKIISFRATFFSGEQNKLLF
ncbi:MAG: hypothetical protein KDK36_19055, partial [Leptospiraceae bacterium]|nr:hypothetical protein [Leptospiraceae bacterium]